MMADSDNTVSEQSARTMPGGLKKPESFDPDFGKTGFARHLFRLRFRRLKLSQRAFAKRYGLGYACVRDLEQAATQPTPSMRLIIAAIARDPKGMEASAKLAAMPCSCADGRYGCCADRA